MSKEVKIYVLKNPETNEVHYVGRSVNPNGRYRVHIYLAKESKHKNKKDAWICNLLNKDLKPVMEIIDSVTSDDAIEREKHWIEKYRETCDLKNSRDYIENDYLFSEESRKKTSDSHIGKTLTDEQKKKIGEKSKGNKYRLGIKPTDETLKKLSKPILQYEKDGTFIKEWPSSSQAARELGLRQGLISSALINRGYRKSHGGFIWKFKN